MDEKQTWMVRYRTTAIDGQSKLWDEIWKAYCRPNQAYVQTVWDSLCPHLRIQVSEFQAVQMTVCDRLLAVQNI